MAAERQVRVPDIGDFEDVEVIEVLVAVGDRVEVEQSLVTLESDKATMELPSPHAGVVKELLVSIGDKVSEGSPVLVLEEEAAAARPERGASAGADGAPDSGAGRAAGPAEAPEGDARTPQAEAPEGGARTAPQEAPEGDVPVPPGEPPRGEREPSEAGPAQMLSGAPPLSRAPAPSVRRAHASPSVRRFARELGVDLMRVSGSGRKGRILVSDVQQYVKSALASGSQPLPRAGFAVPEMPEIDFAKWGEVEIQPLSRLRRTSARNVHRSWLTVPHVTQFDEADITDLEEFRNGKQEEARQRGVKLTLLGFLLKAAAVVLEDFPHFNSSLDRSGEALVVKKYVHIGIAVDTEQGLVVPVIRDVDKKGLFELAEELARVSQRARDRKLVPQDLSGGTFTISSLGGIGGTAFTPIVNAPEVAILGVSRAQTRPVHADGSFVPRLLLPLSLSYDHRVIDGADAVRFTTRLKTVLSDIRNLIL